MVGATLSTPCTVKGTVWTCGLTRGSYSALAVWDASQDCVNGSCPTTVFNPTDGVGYTLYRDLTGKETSLSSAFPIGAKPILLETATLP